jgi:hypothetical protein
VCHIGRTRTASALPSIRIVRAVILYLPAYHEEAVILFVRMFVRTITRVRFVSLVFAGILGRLGRCFLVCLDAGCMDVVHLKNVQLDDWDG